MPKFLHNINLNQNELQNVRIQNLASHPNPAVEGQMYYNTGDDTIYFCSDPSAPTWVDIGIAGDITEVAAGTGISVSGGTSGTATVSAALTAGDGLTLTTAEFDLDAALTTVTSIKNNSLIIGGNSQNNTIDFGTDDVILFDTDNSERMRVDAAGVDITGALTVTGSYGLASGDIPNNAADTSGTAAIATTVTVADESSDTSCYPTFVTAASGNLGPKSGTNLTFNSSTGALSATSFSGAISGSDIGSGTIAADRVSTLNQNTSGTAAIATTVTLTDEGTDATCFPVFAQTATGNIALETDASALKYDSSNSTLYATTFEGALTGNATTVTTNANLTGDVTSSGNATSIASDVIINADIKSDAAIAMSKTALVGGTGLTLSTNTLSVDASQTQITSVGTIGTGTWQSTDIGIAYGGTGASTAAAAATALLATSQGGALTIGDGSDTITVPGDLIVTGTTTTNNVETVSTSNGVVFEGPALDGYDGTLISVAASSAKTYTLPNVTGYVALFSTDPSTTAISSTVAELNLTDGGSTIGTTTLTSGDGFLHNDGGTMKQTSIDKLADLFAGSGLTATDSVIAVDTLNQNTTGTAAGLSSTLAVGSGGTGQTSLTDGGVLLGSGSNGVTAMAVLANGEMIVGDGTTDPVAESGATLRTSIGVGTGDSPQFTSPYASTSIELGHASDTTITRTGAGAIAVEGFSVALVKAWSLNHGSTGVSADNGASDSTVFTITHGMGTSVNYGVEIISASEADSESIYTDVTRPSTTTIVVTFASAVANGTYNALVTKFPDPVD